jgi:hypothetical protein
VRNGSLDKARREYLRCSFEAIDVGARAGVGVGVGVGVASPVGAAPSEMASEMEKALEMENSRCRVPSSPRRSRRASLTSKCDVRSDPSLVFRLRTWACAVGDGRWAVGGGPGRRLGGGPGRRLGGGPGRRLGRRPRVLRRASGPQGSRAGTVGRLPSPTAHLCGRRARWSFVGKRAGHDTIELGHEGRGRRGRTRLGRRVPGPVDPVARRLHGRQCFRHRTAIWDGRAIRQTRKRGGKKERKREEERMNGASYPLLAFSNPSTPESSDHLPRCGASLPAWSKSGEN